MEEKKTPHTPTDEELIEEVKLEGLGEATESSVQLGEIRVAGYYPPHELANLIFEMLENNSIKKYLKILENKKKINSATYCE